MAAPKPVRALFTDFKVFSGTANLELTEEICESLGCPLGAAMIKQFSDGEIHLQIQENVRGADVFWSSRPAAGGPAPDGIAADDGRAEARVRRAHHGSVTLLWVCAAGP